jgi:signal transduction histidine kinase
MRLADFIRENYDVIIADWEQFARTKSPAATDMTGQQLRDHARALLEAAVEDLDARQTDAEQERKSKGLGRERRMSSVAQAHAIQRMRAGFRLDQLVSEYRALRATVVRLWDEALADTSDATTRRDLTRFNEAIDEALTESITCFTEKLDEYRDQFLAVLGHDLRNPLGAIKMSATLLTRSEALDAKHLKAASRIVRTSERMARMVGDLLDLMRTRLGQGISITRVPGNLENVCRQVIDEFSALHPDRQLVLTCEGDLLGEWDQDRLAQIISNLVGNALQHGAGDRPVTIRAFSEGDTVILAVHNDGPAIPQASLKKIFDPLVRSAATTESPGEPNSMGLGLFIVRELANVHGGTVEVASTDEGGTTFTVRLPRHG